MKRAYSQLKSEMPPRESGLSSVPEGPLVARSLVVPRMTPDQLATAKDRDLPASLIAIRRAARAARELAVRTNTAVVVMRDQKPVRITADELRNLRIR